MTCTCTHTAVGIRRIYSSKIICAFQHRKAGGFLRVHSTDFKLDWRRNGAYYDKYLCTTNTHRLILHNTFINCKLFSRFLSIPPSGFTFNPYSSLCLSVFLPLSFRILLTPYFFYFSDLFLINLLALYPRIIFPQFLPLLLYLFINYLYQCIFSSFFYLFFLSYPSPISFPLPVRIFPFPLLFSSNTVKSGNFVTFFAQNIFFHKIM